MTFDKVKEMADGAKFMDVSFSDMYGVQQKFTFPIEKLEESIFKDGLFFDGSSVRSWQPIDKSDMVVVPDMNTAFIDATRQEKVIHFIGYIVDPRDQKRYHKDPRSILHYAVEYLKSAGIGDSVYFGPEPEFFVFDSIRFQSTQDSSFYEINSEEGHWESSKEGSLGNQIRPKSGYFQSAPLDTLADFRDQVMMALEEIGIPCELHHHEVATAGQCEVGMRFNEAVFSADNVMKLKFIVKNIAAQYGKTATFMPKPIFGDNGSGMHVHFSIWKDGKNTFAGNGYHNLSDEALFAIGGILKHGRAIQVFTNPSINSYKRLIPGFEAPVKLAYSATNRSAAVRIPGESDMSDKSKRIEFRCPDSSGSPYLAFAAMLMAVVDGIQNKIHPGDPTDKDIYELPESEKKSIPSTCSSLEEAISELKKDTSWLTKGNVFSPEMIDAYIDYRIQSEIMEVHQRPNPHEYELYYNV